MPLFNAARDEATTRAAGAGSALLRSAARALGTGMRTFRCREDGSIAITFALALLPIMLAMTE